MADDSTSQARQEVDSAVEHPTLELLCPVCFYPLEPAEDLLCPECGRSWEATEVRQFWNARGVAVHRAGRQLMWAAFGFAVWSTNLLVVILSEQGTSARDIRSMWFFPSLAGACFIAALVVRVLRKKQSFRPIRDTFVFVGAGLAFGLGAAAGSFGLLAIGVQLILHFR